MNWGYLMLGLSAVLLTAFFLWILIPEKPGGVHPKRFRWPRFLKEESLKKIVLACWNNKRKLAVISGIVILVISAMFAVYWIYNNFFMLKMMATGIDLPKSSWSWSAVGIFKWLAFTLLGMCSFIAIVIVVIRKVSPIEKKSRGKQTSEKKNRWSWKSNFKIFSSLGSLIPPLVTLAVLSGIWIRTSGWDNFWEKAGQIPYLLTTFAGVCLIAWLAQKQTKEGSRLVFVIKMCVSVGLIMLVGLASNYIKPGWFTEVKTEVAQMDITPKPKVPRSWLFLGTESDGSRFNIKIANLEIDETSGVIRYDFISKYASRGVIGSVQGVWNPDSHRFECTFERKDEKATGQLWLVGVSGNPQYYTGQETYGNGVWSNIEIRPVW